MERLAAVVATLAAGALIAFQPPANAQLSKHTGVLGAAFVSLLVSTAIVGALLIAAGETGRLGGLTEFRPEHMLGGIAGAAIVTVSLVTVKQLGAGGVVAATVCTQLIVSVVLDRVGVLGLDRTTLDPVRLAGFALLIAGTLLVTLR